MSAEDIAAIAGRHKQYVRPLGRGLGDLCKTCEQGGWPCDARRLLDALTQAEAREGAVADDLEALASDLVSDHRGIPYDVIERIDAARALLEGGQP